MGRMNGFMFGGKVFGIAGGMAGTGYLLEYHGFASAMLGMLVLFMIPATAALIIRERAGEKLLPWTAGQPSPDITFVNDKLLPILGAALRNLLRPQGLVTVLVILIYSIHQRLNEMTDALFAIRQLGWNQAELGSLMGVSNVAMGLLCLTLGGWMVDQFGARRIAVWSGVIALPVMGVYIVDPALWGDDRLYVVWFFAKNVPLYLFYLANLVLMMRATAKEAAALSFALYAAIVPIGFMIGAAMLPLLEDMGGWQAMFGASAAFIFIAGLVALLIANDRIAPGEGIDPASIKEPTT
jgi:PAT family beta-lactamase induction signal transducer AmpG